MTQAFARWLQKYELACEGMTVCAPLGDFGSGRPCDAARYVSELHDRMTLGGGGKLA